MAGWRYTNEEKELLTNLVKDKKRDFEYALEDAQKKGDSVLEGIIAKQLAIVATTLDKLTGAFVE
jgi:hypothetical protein